MTATSPGVSAPIMLGGTLKRQTLRKDWYLAREAVPCDWRECSSGSYCSLETPSVFTAEGILQITTACLPSQAPPHLHWWTVPGNTPMSHCTPQIQNKAPQPRNRKQHFVCVATKVAKFKHSVLQQPILRGQWVEESIYNELKFIGFLNINCFSNHQLKPKPNKNQPQSHGTNQVYGG